jgi:Ca-activated chloride channel homolog
MRWNSPEFLLLLAAIPLVVAYKLVVLLPLRKGGVLYPLTRRAIEAGSSWKVRLLWVPDVLRGLVLVLFVMALMQPQWGMSRETVNRQGIDIMLALDVSGSMAAEDFKPNRLKAAQEITERFINGLQDHRIGLVVFAGIALTQCPLTLDYGVVTELLRRTSLEMLKVDGTAIGDALLNALYKFKRGPGEKRDQVIVLLTDGENNAGVVDPLEAARMVAERQVRVYTIAVGSIEGAPIPIRDALGRQGYARNRDGSLYIPKIDEQLLKDIAYLTGGAFFRATDNEALDNIYKTIATLERGKLDISRTIQYAERFYWFLAPAAALLALELFLRLRVFSRVF